MPDRGSAVLSGHTGQACFIYSQGPRGFVGGGSHAEEPLAVLSPGLFYVPPLPSIWALRNTVFRRDAAGGDSNPHTGPGENG